MTPVLQAIKVTFGYSPNGNPRYIAKCNARRISVPTADCEGRSQDEHAHFAAQKLARMLEWSDQLLGGSIDKGAHWVFVQIPKPTSVEWRRTGRTILTDISRSWLLCNGDREILYVSRAEGPNGYAITPSKADDLVQLITNLLNGKAVDDEA